MVKQKVTADVRSLADRYFCEQCDRLGLPRPHAIKPIKTLKLGRTMREVAIDRAKMDRDTRGFIDPELVARDRGDGLRLERELMGDAPKMGLEAIWEAFDGSDGSQQ